MKVRPKIEQGYAVVVQRILDMTADVGNEVLRDCADMLEDGKLDAMPSSIELKFSVLALPSVNLETLKVYASRMLGLVIGMQPVSLSIVEHPCDTRKVYVTASFITPTVNIGYEPLGDYVEVTDD